MLGIAAAITLAPFVVQTATLVLTRSVEITIVVAIVLALAFVAGAIGIQAKLAGSLRAVSVGSVVGVLLAVGAYHAFAVAVSYVLFVKVFGGA